jgi:hypothetical protein
MHAGVPWRARLRRVAFSTYGNVGPTEPKKPSGGAIVEVDGVAGPGAFGNDARPPT